jgi:hypothetical protein
VPHIAYEGPTLPEEGLEVFSSAYPLLIGLDSSNDAWVYSIVKIMHLHFDDYKNNAPGATGWTLERQKFNQAFIPFHPGAIRYYKEIGAWDDAAQAQNESNLERQRVLAAAWSGFVSSAPQDYDEFQQAWLVVREKALSEANLITLGQGL